MMEHAKELLRDAQEKLLRADHLAFMTYPQVKEPKMLALVLENVDAVFSDCMEALLDYERMYKRISVVKGDFDSELRMLREHCLKRYGYPDRVANVISEVRFLAEKKKGCQMEFQRKDQYVLCSDSYRLDFLDIRKVSEYVREAGKFLERTLEVVR